jgi:hypothetical protein
VVEAAVQLGIEFDLAFVEETDRNPAARRDGLDSARSRLAMPSGRKIAVDLSIDADACQAAWVVCGLLPGGFLDGQQVRI